MSFENLYPKDQTFIEKRWQPIEIKLILEEDLEKKISIIREAKKQAAKEIQDQDELHAFLELLEEQLLYYQACLNQNGSANAQEPVQRNEVLNTGEITQVEKINWEAGLAELAFMFEILFRNTEIGCSMNQYKSRWALIAKHFTVKGEEITSEGLRHAFSQLKINKNEGKPAKHEMYETLLKLIQEIED